MAGMKPSRIPHPHDVLALFTTGIVYWLKIAPGARGELRRWKSYAQSIPDPLLRRHALEKLSNEALNPEAATFFAVLAPKTHRARLVRLIVAYQVMYDFLDAVNEEPGFSSLRDGLQLHSALTHAVQDTQVSTDYYGHDSRYNDGGYLDTLVNACRNALDSFPSRTSLTPALIVAAKRCGEAQSHNHAVSVEGYDQLIRWSQEQAINSDYLWWELAAGGISCLAIHALFSFAAISNATTLDAKLVDAAYFPPVCAISALLDSLIDLPHDSNTTNHSFAAHYMSDRHASERYNAIIADGVEKVKLLRNARRHRVILAGITGYYLSAAEASGDFAYPVRINMTKREPIVLPILTIMRFRRWAHDRRLRRSRE